MAAKKQGSGGLKKYAKSSGGGLTGGPTCKTCDAWPQATPAIAEYVAAVDAGDPDFRRLPVATDSNGPSLLQYLREEYGYDLGETALRRHVNRCARGKK